VIRRCSVLVVVLAVCAGCAGARSGTLGPAPTGPPPSGAAPSSVAAPSGEAASPSGTGVPGGPGSRAPGPSGGVVVPPPRGGTPTAPQGTVTVALWFVRNGVVVPTRRTRPATPATSRLVLTELLAGPSSAEAAAGLVGAIPAGVEFHVAGIADGVATVSFDAAFYAGAPETARLRRAQVVYSLTQFPTVNRVAFASRGQSLGGAVGGPAGRAEYADLLAPIVVTSPVIGETVASPVMVVGTADVVEATVNVRLLDAAGREVATAFTTASCGGGCRGGYSVAVPFRATPGGPGLVEVYEVSAEDGARRNVVAIAVVFPPDPP